MPLQKKNIQPTHTHTLKSSLSWPRLYPLSSHNNNKTYFPTFRISTWTFFFFLIVVTLCFHSPPPPKFIACCFITFHSFFKSFIICSISFYHLTALSQNFNSCVYVLCASNYQVIIPLIKHLFMYMNKGWLWEGYREGITILHGVFLLLFLWRMMEQQQHTHTHTKKIEQKTTRTK